MKRIISLSLRVIRQGNRAALKLTLRDLESNVVGYAAWIEVSVVSNSSSASSRIGFAR